MNFFWLESPLCRQTRDLLLDQVTAPASGITRGGPSGPSPALPEASRRHLAGCRSCRTLAESLPILTAVTPTWAPVPPPPGLARDTALRLAPFWPVRERAVNRQEVRMIWSSGLALAATSLVGLLFVLDGLFPLLPAEAHHPLVRVGLFVGAAQLLGGSLLSLTLLVLDARRRRATRRAAEAEVGSPPSGEAR